MELRHLRTFLAVADALHFGRASRRLHVSQPAVSQTVKQLEEELATSLFERRGTAVALTAAGETFRAYATRALEDVDAGKRAIRELATLGTGTLRIGYIPSLTAGLVVPAVAGVMRKWPGVRIEAGEGATRRIERRVAEGRVDVGLGFAPVRDPDVEAEPILERRLALVLPRRHALAEAPRVTAKQLADEPLALLARGMRVRALVDAWMMGAHVAPRLVFEANAVATLFAIVRAGLAVTILPEPRFEAAEGLLAVALSPSPPSHLGALLWRKGAPRSAAALAFADEVRAIVG